VKGPLGIPHRVAYRGAVFKKNEVGHASQFLGRCGGSRERKGFMVKVWWARHEQQEYEVVGQLPGY
jgi:hypothetical protein